MRIYMLSIQGSEPVPEDTQEFIFNAFRKIERIQGSSEKHKPQKQIKQLKLTGGSDPKPFFNSHESSIGERRAVRFFNLVAEGMPINKANVETAQEFGVEERQIRRDRKNYPEAEDYVRGYRSGVPDK